MTLSQPMSSERTKVGVIGGGAWGTALAAHSARMGHETLLYAREKEVVASVNDPSLKENSTFLKGVRLPDSLKATDDIDQLLQHTDIFLMVVPTPFVAATMSSIKDKLRPEQIMISCTKGILNDTLETVNQVLERVLDPAFHSRLAFLSGPSFAAEVAKGLPTVVTIASRNQDVALRAQALLSTSRFRCYTTDDVEGVELGGSLKNVLAIACGISDGLGYGNNGRAALITRGLGEISRIALKQGANPLTLSGLAGIGDLVLTCTGDLSRNRTVGLRIGRGETLEQITGDMTAIAEGVLTARSAHMLAKKLGVQAPIIDGICRVLYEKADPAATVEEVMSRALHAEIDHEMHLAARGHAKSA